PERMETGRNSIPSNSYFLSPLRLVAVAILAAGGLCPAFPAQAQYPQKPIRVFLPFAAGGIGDITFRLVTGKISVRTGMQFAIDNRPGAGGIQSAMAGKTAAPDGYTLLQIGNSYTVSASLFPSLPYDLVKD